MTTLLQIIALGTVLALTSCSTFTGFGQDLQHGGAALEQKARESAH